MLFLFFKLGKKMISFSSGTCLAASNPITSANPCFLCLHRFDHCNTIIFYIIIIMYKKYSVTINNGMIKMLKIIISTLSSLFSFHP